MLFLQIIILYEIKVSALARWVKFLINLRGNRVECLLRKYSLEAGFMMFQTTLVWFRNDLRVFDHTALQEAVRFGLPVVGLYVFEPIESVHSEGGRRRRVFVHQCLSELQSRLAEKGVPLFVTVGLAEQDVPAFAREIDAIYVVCASADEPEAVNQENMIAARLIEDGCRFKAVNDHVLLSKFTLADSEGRPYTEFQVYRKAWLAASAGMVWQASDDWQTLARLQTGLSENLTIAPEIPSLAQLGVADQSVTVAGGEQAADELLAEFLLRMGDYHPEQGLSVKCNESQLWPYLRFGVLSVRYVIDLIKNKSASGAGERLDALIRREFYHQLIYHYPNVLRESFNPKYRNIVWENNPVYFSAWQQGQTGYPLLDASMRYLNQTGYLPDELRNYTAAFLTQILLCDWRLGAAYFAGQLLDFDLAVNNGSWQDAAGVGTKAFRPEQMMHPVFAAQKLDPAGQIIRRYIPELAHMPKDFIHMPWLAKGNMNTNNYPDPIVEYASQREKALVLYGAG
ncbi:deoxyribodipyrimidine photo-lyase [Neisseria wadsworthii 9715]|uniref:Deoxyribodipyrimidine photo-lyase n=2 Tax=Neisseria TaxID=482 RepID=G4CTI6_9NEIS|nr:deoxyribodipyrimidine photo-lyase [Neisseria wadsworthii 9715]